MPEVSWNWWGCKGKSVSGLGAEDFHVIGTDTFWHKRKACTVNSVHLRKA